MRPNVPPRSALRQAVRKGILAARHNLVPMLLLQGAMAALVAVYYYWPAGSAILADYATWQHRGGIVAGAFATGLAGGVISEASLVYFLNRGRWTDHNLEHMCFKFFFFCFSGAIVYIFYGYQAIWFGHGNSWPVLLKKIFVDQFVYSFFWAAPFNTLMLRWHALRYSGSKLWLELDLNFITDRILPVIITNWMFWIPGVFLIYSMPTPLQVPLFIFATAIWGILLPAVAKQEREVLEVEEKVVLN